MSPMEAGKGGKINITSPLRLLPRRRKSYCRHQARVDVQPWQKWVFAVHLRRKFLMDPEVAIAEFLLM
jgi:hypothetical protein